MKGRTATAARRTHPALPVFVFPCLVVLILALSGCMKVGPDFSPIEAPVSGQWLEADQGQVKTGQEVAPQWWKTLGDPVLDRLVDLAARQNLSLQAAGLRVYQARAALGVAVGSLYPQTQTASGSLTYQHPSDRGPTAPQPGSTQPNPEFWTSSLAAGASWELDFWGKYGRGVEAADATLRSGVADYDNALTSLTANVAQTYVLIRTLEDRLRIARQSVIDQQEGLRIATARFDLGSTNERDVQQATSLLSGTEATIPVLRDSLAQAKHSLCLLLGMAPSDLGGLLGSDSAIPEAPAQVAVGIPADLLRRRPDVRKAENDAAAQCARIGVAKADLYPSFSLTGTVGFQTSNVGLFELSDFGYGFMAQAGPGISWSLFNYGRITNNVRAQDALFQTALVNYRNTVLGALGEVENAQSNFLRTREQAKSLAASVAAARRSVELSLIQYREGATDFTTVLTAEQDLLTKQDSLANSRGNIVQGLVALYRALGGGWEIRQGKDFVPGSVRQEMARRTDWGGLLDESPEKTANPPADAIRTPDW